MKLRLFTAIAVTAMAMISCTEDTDIIGSSITNDADKLIFSTGVYNATSRSILADSVYSHNTDNYFGMVKDPETKTYVKSDIMAQFNMIEGFKLPSKDRILSKIDGDVVVDSCFISLFVSYSKSYGDTLNAMKMRVTELNEPIDDKFTHYSNFDLKANGYLRNDGLKVNKMFSVRDLKLSDGNLWSLQHNIPYQGTSSDSGYYDRILVPLNVPYTAKNGNTYNNYGTYVMRTYFEHPEYFTNSYRFVHNVCPGFNFEITDGLGVMANIKEINIQMFYSFLTEADTTAYTSIYLTSTPEVLQTAHIVNDRAALEQLVADNSCTYLKSPAGIFTEVTLPVDEISQAHATDSLLTVSVNFQRQNSDFDVEHKLNASSNILMVHKDSLYSFFENKTMYDYKSSFYASLDKTNNYTFSNIGNLITLMAQQKANGLKSDPNWVANHPNWNKVVLVPIATSVKYSSDYYGNTTSTVSGVYNQMGISSTKLVGGDNTPIEVKVIYAKFND